LIEQGYRLLHKRKSTGAYRRWFVNGTRLSRMQDAKQTLSAVGDKNVATYRLN